MQYSRYSFAVPEEKIARVITDTDLSNEADDHFAVAQAALSPRFDNRGYIAAHFGIKRRPDSMEESYRELHNMAGILDPLKNSRIRRGATNPLPDMTTAVESAGARLIIEEALSDDPRPLYVLFLGPLTDLASA